MKGWMRVNGKSQMIGGLDAMGAFGKTSGLYSQVFSSRQQENDP